MKHTVRELRILSGLHAGATVPVDAELMIGSDPACDIILDDDGIRPRHARLIVEDDHWALFEPDADLTAVGTELPAPISSGTLGEPCTYGPLCFAIELADTPWKSQEDYRTASHVDSTAASAAEFVEPVDSHISDATPPSSGATTSSSGLRNPWHWRKTSLPRLPGLRRLSRLPRIVLIGFWIALFAAAGIGAFLQYQSLQSSRALERATREATARQKYFDTVNTTLKTLGTGANLRVTSLKDGKVAITGWVDDEGALNKTSAALKALQPAPEMHLTTVALLQQSLKDALQPYGTRVGFELQKAGNVRISGGVKDGSQKDEILRTVKAQVPQIGDIEDYLMQPPQLVQMFRSQLRSSEFPDAEANWDGARMVLKVKLSDEDRETFERLLMDFNSKYGDVVPFVAQTPGDTRNAPKVVTGSAEGVPFRVVSVIGGGMPFVVLDEGVKVMPGGTHKGFRLVSISDKEVVFDGPRRIELRR